MKLVLIGLPCDACGGDRGACPICSGDGETVVILAREEFAAFVEEAAAHWFAANAT